MPTDEGREIKRAIRRDEAEVRELSGALAVAGATARLESTDRRVSRGTGAHAVTSPELPRSPDAARAVLGSVLLCNTAVGSAIAALSLECLEIPADTAAGAAAVPLVSSRGSGRWRRV